MHLGIWASFLATVSSFLSQRSQWRQVCFCFSQSVFDNFKSASAHASSFSQFFLSTERNHSSCPFPPLIVLHLGNSLQKCKESPRHKSRICLSSFALAEAASASANVSSENPSLLQRKLFWLCASNSSSSASTSAKASSINSSRLLRK